MPHQVGVEFDGPASGRDDAAPFVELIEDVLREDGTDEASVTLLIAGDELLQRLNREHRGIDEPTDVLSFAEEGGELLPSPEGGPRYLGDIAVSIERATVQAEAADLTLDQELRHLVLHGLLHLLGYDHETDDDDAKMSAREEAVLGAGIHAGGGHEGHD
jgi:probable rRNA maturation factor